MPDAIMSMNVLRVHEALAYLAKAQKSLDELNTRDVRGLTKEQLAELRNQVRLAKDSASALKRALKAIDSAAKKV
jgi:hypothetical protein